MMDLTSESYHPNLEKADGNLQQPEYLSTKEGSYWEWREKINAPEKEQSWLLDSGDEKINLRDVLDTVISDATREQELDTQHRLSMAKANQVIQDAIERTDGYINRFKDDPQVSAQHIKQKVRLQAVQRRMIDIPLQAPIMQNTQGNSANEKDIKDEFGNPIIRRAVEVQDQLIKRGINMPDAPNVLLKILPYWKGIDETTRKEMAQDMTDALVAEGVRAPLGEGGLDVLIKSHESIERLVMQYIAFLQRNKLQNQDLSRSEDAQGANASSGATVESDGSYSYDFQIPDYNEQSSSIHASKQEIARTREDIVQDLKAIGISDAMAKDFLAITQGLIDQYQGTPQKIVPFFADLTDPYFSGPGIPLSTLETTPEENLQPLLSAYRQGIEKTQQEHPELLTHIRNVLLDIAIRGKLDGQQIPETPPIMRVHHEFLAAREELIRLYMKNPDLARSIVRNNISLGHASHSASLLGVLKYGIRPQEFLDKAGIVIASGEQSQNSAGSGRYVIGTFTWDSLPSFKDYFEKGDQSVRGFLEDQLLEEVPEDKIKDGNTRETVFDHDKKRWLESIKIAQQREKQVTEFLAREPRNVEETEHQKLIREHFPVLYLVNTENIPLEKFVKPQQAPGGEIDIWDGLARDNTRIILVPKSKIAYVENLIAERGLTIDVFPVEDAFPNM